MPSGHVTRAAAKSLNKQAMNVAPGSGEESDRRRSGSSELGAGNSDRGCMSEFSDKICGKLNALTEEIGAISRKLYDLETTVEFNSDQIKKIEESELRLSKLENGRIR